MAKSVETWRYGPSGETYVVTLTNGEVTDVEGPVDPTAYREAIAFHHRALVEEHLSKKNLPSDKENISSSVTILDEVTAPDVNPKRGK